MALYKTMINYEKTTTMYIYEKLFIELGGHSNEGSSLQDMTV